ncbi:MAG TPA: hypothetical protein VEW92_01850 [Nitrososphaeraceae archaeon]|nr:hypothetical protein [Nitrososphaeraceae archaeon]
MSLLNTSKALVIFRDKNQRSYVSVFNWIQRFSASPTIQNERVSAFVI